MDRKTPVDTHIGQRLKEYRQHRGMTVRELADAAHVTPGQISHYEHGRDRISHERVTEFARILRIKSNDLYQPPGSRLRRNHVRWRLTNFMAAVIAEAAALMSSRRKAAADNEATINEATMVAAVAVAVGASAAAASDAGAGNHATKTAWHVSDDGRGGKIAHDSPVSATGKDTSAQSTPASANGDYSASPFKPTVDHHAIVDPGIRLDLIPTDHLLQHPADNSLHIPAQPDHGADPAHPYVDGNQSASADDSNAHPGKVPHDPPASTARSSDLSGDDSAQPFKTNLDHHAVDDPETNSPSNSNNHPLQSTGKDTSAQSTPASANGDYSASPFKPTVDHHAIVDPGIRLDLIPTDHLLQHPADNSLHIPAQPDHGADPAHPYVDGNQSASADDSNAHPGKVPHDPPASTARSSDLSGDDSAQPFKTNLDHHAVDDPETNSPSNSNNHPLQSTGKDTSAQSTPASANGDYSASPFKPTVDHHAIVDPGIRLDLIPTDHLLQHPADNSLHIPAQPDHGADPAHPYVDGNQSASADDSNAHPGKVPHDPPASTARSSDLSGDDSAQPFKTNLDHHAVDDPETNSPSNSNNHPLQSTGKDTSAQSTPASANGDYSASPFKPTVDHHAIVDPGIRLDLIPTDHLLQHPADNSLHIPAQPDHGADPAHPYVDGNQSASADDSNAHPGKVPHDPPASTVRSSDWSGDDSAQPFKTNLDHHAVDDPETNSPSNSNNHPLQQPADNSLRTPAQHDDNGSPAVTDGAHPGLGVDGIESASPKLADDDSTNSGKLDHHASADPDINDQHPADNSLHTLAQPDDGPHPADPPVDVSELPNFKFANNGSGHLDIGPDGAHTAHSQADVDQSDSFKFANNDSAHPGTVVPHDSPTLTTLPSDSSGTHGPAAPNLNVPGTVMSDAASDQFVFEKGHDKVADVKPDMIETDHVVAEIRHLLHTAHDANAVGALDPNHTTAPQDMTKVQLPHHHGDFHFA